ncbi:hypothetical protein [Neisseria elongata]|uniref:hypothetical protein n=1 Tax=Neisseria elongata TaxID=495 RepID=UPI001160D61F|nr:hypothetical protein [Neisseria elongata]
MPCGNTDIRPYLFSDGLHLGGGRLKAGNKAWQDGSFVFAVRKPSLTSKDLFSDGLLLPRGRLKLRYGFSDGLMYGGIQDGRLSVI